MPVGKLMGDMMNCSWYIEVVYADECYYSVMKNNCLMCLIFHFDC
jgi:hypothetical protein